MLGDYAWDRFKDTRNEDSVTMHRTVVFAAVGLLALITALTPGIAAEYSSSDGAVTVVDPWTRATASAGGTGAGYMVLVNNGESPDRLIAATSPAAEVMELHTNLMQDGVMMMRPVEAIDLPAGESVALEPGGLHVMFIGTAAPFRPGTPVALTLVFETAGEVMVELPVAAPGATEAPTQ